MKQQNEQVFNSHMVPMEIYYDQSVNASQPTRRYCNQGTDQDTQFSAKSCEEETLNGINIFYLYSCAEM